MSGNKCDVIYMTINYIYIYIYICIYKNVLLVYLS